MKTRCWRSNGSLVFCIYCLVAFLVLFVGLALNIFRQWCFPEFFEHTTKLLFTILPQKTNGTSAAGGIINYLGYEFFPFAEIQFVANTDLSFGVNDHIPKPVWFVEFAQ